MKRLALVAAFSMALGSAPVLSAPGHAPAQQAEAACVKARPWKKTVTKFGIGLNVGGGTSNLGEDLRYETKRFGTRIRAVRTWDTGMPRDNAWAQRSEWFGRRTIITSIKVSPQQINSGRYDAQLRHYFKTAPTDRPIFYSFFHEPEDEVKRGEFTPKQFRIAFRRVVNIASSFCRTNLYPTLILMGWTADPHSGLHWRDYYPGKDYVSVLGWDAYNGANGDATRYRAPKDVFGPVIAASRSAGKRFGIAETGTIRIPGDADGTGRAAWLRKVDTYLDSQNAAWVTYFQSTNKGDFELRDRPGLRAWAAAME